MNSNYVVYDEIAEWITCPVCRKAYGGLLSSMTHTYTWGCKEFMSIYEKCLEYVVEQRIEHENLG